MWVGGRCGVERRQYVEQRLGTVTDGTLGNGWTALRAFERMVDRRTFHQASSSTLSIVDVIAAARGDRLYVAIEDTRGVPDGSASSRFAPSGRLSLMVRAIGGFSSMLRLASPLARPSDARSSVPLVERDRRVPSQVRCAPTVSGLRVGQPLNRRFSPGAVRHISAHLATLRRLRMAKLWLLRAPAVGSDAVPACRCSELTCPYATPLRTPDQRTNLHRLPGGQASRVADLQLARTPHVES